METNDEGQRKLTSYGPLTSADIVGQEIALDILRYVGIDAST